MRYLSAYVYRSNLGDATNGGVSSELQARDKIFLIPAERGNWTDEEVEAYPERFVVFDVIQSEHDASYRYLRPRGMEGKWMMYGGNYLFSCDSRWRESHGHFPLPIHDRYEG